MESLRSEGPFQRERAATQIYRRGAEALPALAEALEARGPAVDRARADRIFQELLAGLLAEFESEMRALLSDRAEAEALRRRRAAAEAQPEAQDGEPVAGGPPGDLEVLRLEELEERIAERAPKVEESSRRIESLGLAALNGVLARRSCGRDRIGAPYDEIIRRTLQVEGADLVLEGDLFEARRYARSLLWTWEIDRKGPRSEEVEGLLRRHVEATLGDLDSPEDLVRRRAAAELYLLGQRGREALERFGSKPGVPFLRHLLRWRIHPDTYSRTGMDLRGYSELGFRQRRQQVFDYARVAGEEAIPTLRAIVQDESLEPSLFVRIGAAKALAGLRDMSGFEFLLLKHPDLTLTRPEVSRDLALAQGVNLIRDEKYDEAVEILKKVLEEFPYDFRANYHIAFAYLLAKSFAKAVHHFEIAKRIDPDDQLTLYNLACAYALSGKKDEALRELQAAVRAGFADVEHIEKDPDLESLRDDPRFRKLVEDLRRSSDK
jgi:Flp pilus assembly protein TadD